MKQKAVTHLHVKYNRTSKQIIAIHHLRTTSRHHSNTSHNLIDKNSTQYNKTQHSNIWNALKITCESDISAIPVVTLFSKYLRYHEITFNSRPIFVKASTARSTSCNVCAAESCTRMRALPLGTTG